MAYQIVPSMLLNALTLVVTVSLAGYGAVRYVRDSRREELLAFVVLVSSVSLWESRANGGNGAWLPTAAQRAVADRAREAGVPVVRVTAPGRRDDCHRCGATGTVDEGQLSCPSDSCPVDEMGRGQNAAIHLARRGARE